MNTNVIHRKRRSADNAEDQETSQIRVYEFYEPRPQPRAPPSVVHNPKEALEAKDLANDTFFYEKLKASIPKLKEGEKDDVELIKNNKSGESDTDDESDEEDDGSSELDESNASDESDGDDEKSSLTMSEPDKSKEIEFVQNPDRTLKEVEKAFQNNNRYIEKEQEEANNDDGSEEPKLKKPIFKTKHFSRDFESAGDLLREVHTLVKKKKTEPEDGNHYWKIEYQNPTV